MVSETGQEKKLGTLLIKGMTVSTIAEERAHNPRLQVASGQEYAEIMDNLALPTPKMMDIAVPSNRALGLSQEKGREQGWGLTAAEAIAEAAAPGVMMVDLREETERLHGAGIPGAVHAPYGALDQFLGAGGLLQFEATDGGKRLIFFCPYGERSAMAVEAAHEAGLDDVRSIMGGIEAWLAEGGPVDYAGPGGQGGD